MHTPRFITFTGADDHTSIAGMCELAAQYPIEWGLLFSPKHQGNGRYPSLAFIAKLTSEKSAMNFAAHVCGGHSRDAAAGGKTAIDPYLHDRFNRIQINIRDGLDMMSTGLLARWARSQQAAPILQCRGPFPTDGRFSWLFDQSGGRGQEPGGWPEPASTWHAQATLKGYAGGLNPLNVRQHVETIGAKDERYWIDMESGVRDERDRFDLARCRAVCEAVYGAR